MTQADVPGQEIIYPESDGQPMVDNSKQYRWIVRLTENLKRFYANQVALVSADMFWYPVEGRPDIKNAPDVFVAIGRPDGNRGSYKQWEEANIAPQVVFEIISPGNTGDELVKKQEFYIEHGVLEIFFYNPDTLNFWGFIRNNREEAATLLMRRNLPWTSPVMGLRFEMEADDLAIFYPDGQRFEDPQNWIAERDKAWAKLRELGVDPEQL